MLLHASVFTASGEYGASGAITWARVVSFGRVAARPGRPAGLIPAGLVEPAQRPRAHQPGLERRLGAQQQRIAGFVALDVLQAQILGLDVGAGVPEQTSEFQMQKGRPPGVGDSAPAPGGSPRNSRCQIEAVSR